MKTLVSPNGEPTHRRTVTCLGLLILLAIPGMLRAADPSDDVQADAAAAEWFAPRLSILDFGWDTRFNYMDREAGLVTDRGLQYRLRTRARIDIHKDGKTYFTLRAETGKGFDNSWNNTAAALGRGQAIFNVKSISLHQKFADWLDGEAGGLDFDAGAGTDAIYASGDGHMTGYRAAMKPNWRWLPGKISVTAAYLGDFAKPNFFSRARMDRINYVQLLIQQHFTENVEVSGGLDSIHGIMFGRGAVRYRHMWIFDDARIEAAARATDRCRFAWSSTLSRRWGASTRWRTDLIYAGLPFSFYMSGSERILLNRGEIDVGKRLATGAAYRIGHDFEASVFSGRLLDATPSKRWVAQAGISYQFAGLIKNILH